MDSEYYTENQLEVLEIVKMKGRNFDNTGEDMEDLISIRTIGLIKTIESFSPGQRDKAGDVNAARCIENEIFMHLRSLKKSRKDVPLHDPIVKRGNEITLIGILGSEADISPTRCGSRSGGRRYTKI